MTDQEQRALKSIDAGLASVMVKLDDKLASIPEFFARSIKQFMLEFLREAYVAGQAQLMAELQKGLLDQLHSDGYYNPLH